MASIDLGETYQTKQPTPATSAQPTWGRDYGLGIGVMGQNPEGYVYSYNRPDYSSQNVPDQPIGSFSSSPSMSQSSGSKAPTQKVIGSTTSTTKAVAPGIAMPSFGNVPAIDEMRIKRLTQTRSAAGQRALRSALRESLTQATYQDNPNVAAMISKKSLEGFGQGIAETYTRAQAQATAEEARDRGMQMQKQSAVFNASMQDYMKRFGSVQTTKHDFVNPNASGGMGEIQTSNPRMANYMSPAQALVKSRLYG